jgi:hypothetical protein
MTARVRRFIAPEDAAAMDRMEKALLVITLDPRIAAWFITHDPMALRQACDALVHLGGEDGEKVAILRVLIDKFEEMAREERS